LAHFIPGLVLASLDLLDANSMVLNASDPTTISLVIGSSSSTLWSIP
jgi:hypothetical protein